MFKNKIAAVAGCSNLTGIQTACHQIAKVTNGYNSLRFIGFASII